MSTGTCHGYCITGTNMHVASTTWTYIYAAHVRCIACLSRFLSTSIQERKLNSPASSFHYPFWFLNGTHRATDEHQCYLFPRPTVTVSEYRMCRITFMLPCVKAPALRYCRHHVTTAAAMALCCYALRLKYKRV